MESEMTADRRGKCKDKVLFLSSPSEMIQPAVSSGGEHGRPIVRSIYIK